MAEIKTNQEMSIEETLEALEMIIEKMEDRDSSLEETFANYELGMKMVKSCSDQIDRVEKKIFKVVKSNSQYNDIYDKRYQVYTELYPNVKDLYKINSNLS